MGKPPLDAVKFNEIPLECVDKEDRSILTAVAKAMILSQQLPCISWTVEVLTNRAYNKIIVTYPADTVFLMKAHLLPIWKSDPGLLESPTFEYINDIWSEFKDNYTNLVCRVMKHACKNVSSTAKLSAITDHPSPAKEEDVEVFDERGNYVYDHKTKKRKL